MISSYIADVEFGGAIPASTEIVYVFEGDDDVGEGAIDEQLAEAQALGRRAQEVIAAALVHLDPDTRAISGGSVTVPLSALVPLSSLHLHGPALG